MRKPLQILALPVTVPLALFFGVVALTLMALRMDAAANIFLGVALNILTLGEGITK
jgi:hypothetical protein